LIVRSWRPSRHHLFPAGQLAAAILIAAVALFASPTFAETRLGPQSGLPVPRFASLKFGEVNGREGPSMGHGVVWQYRRRGLPMLIIEEDLEWRKVRDPDGDEVWINARGLDGRRMGLVTNAPAELRRRPEGDAPVAAVAEPGVLFEIRSCRDGWMRVDGARASGWLPEGALWGPGCE
jgi:SH3-like domain-containing protein